MGGSVSFPALRQDLTRIVRGIKPCPIAPIVAPAYDRAMPKQDFTHVETWVFDLDNTLYPPSARLFDQIEAKMSSYVMREIGLDRETADHMRDHWWRNHGTTLAGLMEGYGIDPQPFLDEVHD